MQISSEHVEKIINEVDYFGNHKINYSEFLAATPTAEIYQYRLETMTIPVH